MKHRLAHGKVNTVFFGVGQGRARQLLSGIGFFLLVFTALVFITSDSTPLSELSYVEYSALGKQAGSVVPASCDSATPFTSPTSQGGTAGSHFPNDCITPCPQGGGSYDPYYDPGASACPITRYRICPASAVINSGFTVQLRAYYRATGLDCANLAGANDVTGSVTWTSSNLAVATVGNGASAGLVTGVAPVWGWTSISTTPYLGLIAPSANVTVNAPLSNLRICPLSAKVGNGATTQLRAYYRVGGVDCANPAGATDVTGSVTWTSSNPAIATLGNGASAGLVTGIAAGSINATISQYLGITAPPTPVSVTGNLSICPTTASVGSGATTQLRAYYRAVGAINCANLTGTTDVTTILTWATSNPTRATVGNGASAGLVTGVTAGTANVSVVPYLGAVAPAVPVTVGGAYKICPASAIVSTSGFPFHGYYNPAGLVDCSNLAGTVDVTGSVAWSSSNPGVATVGNGASAGIATAVSLGTANISTTPYLGLSSAPAVVSVICIPSVSCASAGPAATAANMCPAQTFTVNDGCGGLVTCSGTRTCDFNWKEVSQ